MWIFLGTLTVNSHSQAFSANDFNVFGYWQLTVKQPLRNIIGDAEIRNPMNDVIDWPGVSQKQYPAIWKKQWVIVHKYAF